MFLYLSSHSCLNIASALAFVSFSSGLRGEGLTKKSSVIGPPNIIFIVTDDQRWDMLGCSGNPIIHTPNMDKMAEEGVRFTKAFVTTPICAASRASFFTGLYERTHLLPLVEFY